MIDDCRLGLSPCDPDCPGDHIGDSYKAVDIRQRAAREALTALIVQWKAEKKNE